MSGLLRRALGGSLLIYPPDHHTQLPYTGNGTAIGSGGNAVTGAGFPADLVWIKNRVALDNHMLTDRVRGATKYFRSNSSIAQATDTEALATFGSDGFTLGNNVEVNTNAETYIAWCWKANGAGASNADGSITATVSANVAAGFAIAAWTGDNAVSATIGHGLGATPTFIIVKNLTDATDPIADHVNLTTGKLLILDTTGAETTVALGDFGTHTSSVIEVKRGSTSANVINGSGDSMVAYIWTDIAGLSAFGSYEGNGSTTGPVVSTGFRPRLLIIKEQDSTGPWVMLDSARDTSNPVDAVLFANSTDVEASSSNYDVDFNDDGFSVKTLHTDVNTNASTYIYATWA